MISRSREGECELNPNTLLANLPGMAYVASAEPTRQLSYVSDRVLDLTGRTAEAFTSSSTRWIEIVHPEDVEAVEREVESALREPRGFSLIYRIVHASGALRWVLDRGELVDDERGEHVAFAGFVSDVTELRQEHERLRESEARFRLSFDKAAIGLAQGDMENDGRLLRANDWLCEMTGYTHEELHARKLQDITHPDDVEADLIHARQVIAGEVPIYSREKRYIRKDGRILWAKVTGSIVRRASGEPDFGIAVIKDITDRKQAEAALRESEAWLRLAQEAGGVGLYDWDVASGDLRCSANFFRVIARSHPASGTITLDEGLAWLHTDDLTRITDDNRAGLMGLAERVAACLRVLGEDGVWRWFAYQSEFHRDPGGRVIRVLGAIHDVTSQKQIQEQLRVAHERLSLALCAGRAGLWDWEIQRGSLLFLSPEYREIYGLPADEPVTYERWLELVHPDDRDRVKAYGDEVFAEGDEYSLEFRIAHPTRGVRWFRSVGKVYRDAEGHAVRFSGVSIDITALKRALRELRASEERLRDVLDAMFAFVGVLAPDGTLVEGNRAPAELVGKACEDLLGNKFWDGPWWDEDARARVRGAFERAVGGEVVRYDETVWTLDDGRMNVDFQLQPVCDGDTLQFVIASAVDITDRKRAEHALKEADRQKDEFLATLAHELRNPLAPLRTGFEVLKRSVDRGTRERAREMMERQLEHMVRLIDDLLDVSRISRGKLELEREPVALQVVVQHALETVAPLIETRKQVLTTHLPDQPVWIDGDLIRLAQVVGNLLNNASKYTPERGNIDLAVCVEDGEAVVVVRDAGGGISAEMLPNVFNLFAQAARDRGRAQGGLGIGLFLVRRLVEMHGGTITAHSPGVGQGSTFTIRFPLAASRPRQLGARGRFERSDAQIDGRRILVVDDNEDAAELLATVLGLHGYETRIAHDGPSAVAIAKSYQPDVAFLDIGLPGMSGHELARAFRADPDLAGTVLIALTGWGGEEDKRRAREAGFDHHLTKPIDVAAIESILAQF
jgi:PAS domain S-box-containing protein